MANEKVENGDKFLLLAKEGWHEGVLGIVASKIVETYALPTLILNIDLEQHHAKVQLEVLNKCLCSKF